MATFIEEGKRQRRLIYILLTTLIITAITLWWGFLRQPVQVSEEEVLEFLKPVEIDETLLESPVLKGLEQFQDILPFDTGLGRENPFIPY